MGENATASLAMEPANWLDQYGDFLYRYALARVRNGNTAEDLVQETFLAALRSRQQFSGQHTERAWLVGILKHKIADHFRRRNRDQPIGDADPSEALLDHWFNQKGHWKTPPRREEENPETHLERKEFWEVLHRCLGNLPPRLADAFCLREMEELTSDEVCKILNISTTNLGVRIHRARLHLWQCLESNWFGSERKRA